MPVAWKDVCPVGAGGLEPVDHFVAEAARVDEAGDRRRHHVLAGGQQAADVVEGAHRVHLALRHVEHAVGVEGDDLVGIRGRRDADGADAADVADVAAGLGVAVDEGADEFEIGALVHGGDGMAADGSGGPLNDAQHAVKFTVRTTRQAAP